MTNNVKSLIDIAGMESLLVEAECHITNGLPGIVIIGYASKAVDEAKERLRASFANSSLPFPKKRLTINLSPGDTPKASTSLDLAMAVAVLGQSKQIPAEKLGSTVFFGELSLDGSLNAVRGLIGHLLKSRAIGVEAAYIPRANLAEASLVPDIKLKPVGSLRDVFLDLNDMVPIKTICNRPLDKPEPAESKDYVDFAEINGNQIAKRALEIAAAGHHNILLSGPPGTGKTMLAKAVCGILPELDRDEILEVTHLHSLGSPYVGQIITSRPFRAPHHTASTTAIVGGGSKPKPGEASLAHRGVLFLDELPEFSQSALEALRQPLEDGCVTIARVRDHATYPAEFILVATQNPCPCGYYGTDRPCSCSMSSIVRYQKKVSGPILDRIDLHLTVNDIDHKRLLDSSTESQSAIIRPRVAQAYQIQRQRFGRLRFNSTMSNKEVRGLAKLKPEAKDLLDSAAVKLGLSARAYVRCIKVSRTIADLAGDTEIQQAHIAEAIQYRQPTPEFAAV